MRNRALVLDANSLIVRCIMASAMDDLRANGLFTGGIYGSLRSLRSIVSAPELAVDRVVALFDHGVPKRRLQLLPNYKQERREQRAMLSPEEREKAFGQIEKCFGLFGLLGVRCLSFVSREADDGVAAAVRVFAAQGIESIVVSSDADLLQTVSMGASVWDLANARLVDRANFVEVCGVPPQLFTLYRALVGDPSDSVKGAHGCGPKRAAALIAELQAADENELPPPITALPVREQFEELCRFLIRKRGSVAQPELPFDGDEPKAEPLGLRGWEQAILDDAPRLRNVVLGIDLTASFGPTDRLAARLSDLPAVSDRAFLQECRRLRMNSVLGDPEGYLRPFRAVAARRAGKKPVGRV